MKMAIVHTFYIRRSLLDIRYSRVASPKPTTFTQPIFCKLQLNSFNSPSSLIRQPLLRLGLCEPEGCVCGEPALGGKNPGRV